MKAEDKTEAPPAGRAQGRSLGLFLWLALGVIAVVQIVWVFRNTEKVRPTGYAAPNFSLPVLGGGDLTLTALRGQVVLVDFWATWCGPCQESMPALQRLYDKYRDRGFTVVSVNIEGRGIEPKAQGFVRHLGLTFPVVIGSREVMADWRVQTIPHLFVIDREGVVRGYENGIVDVKSFESRLDKKIRQTLEAK